MFCPNCKVILDTCKNIQKPALPTDIKLTEDDYKDIIKNIIEDKEVISIIKMNEIEESKVFKSLDDKSKKKVNNYFKSLNYNNNFYNICSNCNYTKLIKPLTIIKRISKVGDNKDYIDYKKIKNKVYSQILPLTTNYICNNLKCPTQKNPELKEACFFKINNTNKIHYVCRVCLSKCM